MSFVLLPTGCPVCGYPEMQNLDEYECTTFEICPSCGCQSGYTYDKSTTQEHLHEVRKHWIENEDCAWHCKVIKKPKNWNATKQLKDAGLYNV